LRLQGRIVLTVASSGIAACLLSGGSTAHSRFKIPIDITSTSMCHIPRNSQLAELLRSTSLIIWDEAVMVHRHSVEAVDRTLRDLTGCPSSFGGIPIVFGGDFRQILPVVPHGSPLA
jgi:ATP-dependent DNA helicase PIF1